MIRIMCTCKFQVDTSFQDELVLRHKTLPLPICVKLCEGEDRKIEVNSGFPLMDVVPNICKDIGMCS